MKRETQNFIRVVLLIVLFVAFATVHIATTLT